MVSGNPYISVNSATTNAEKAPMARQSRVVLGWKKLHDCVPPIGRSRAGAGAVAARCAVCATDASVAAGDEEALKAVCGFCEVGGRWERCRRSCLLARRSSVAHDRCGCRLECDQVRGRQRSREEVALPNGASVGPQKGELVSRLDSLGYRLQPQAVDQRDQRADDCCRPLVFTHLRDERTIDLHARDGQRLEVSE